MHQVFQLQTVQALHQPCVANNTAVTLRRAANLRESDKRKLGIAMKCIFAESGSEERQQGRLQQANGMKESHGVVELQLADLKLDNVDVIEPLALQLQVCGPRSKTIPIIPVSIVSLLQACLFRKKLGETGTSIPIVSASHVLETSLSHSSARSKSTSSFAMMGMEADGKFRELQS